MYTDYNEFAWLAPAEGETNHCEACRAQLRPERIAWLEQGEDGHWGLPGEIEQGSRGCFAYCATCARRALGSKRGAGRPKAKTRPLQIQLWLSGDRATKVRARAKASGDTPQEVIRRLIDRG